MPTAREPKPTTPTNSGANDDRAVRALYTRLIDAWNQRDAVAYATCCTQDANLVGFDGSVIDGRAEIAAHLGAIFTDHVTATYISIVREVRHIGPKTALLRAVVGMIPPNQTDINPAANAIQSLVAVQQGGAWLVALFHNTPAHFHGRPEEAAALTEELRALL